MQRNMAECLFQKARQQPDHPLIVGPEPGIEISYGEFCIKVEFLAKTLTKAGVKNGDNIGLLYPSGQDYIAFVYGIWACGACVTPLPIELAPTEKRHIFRQIHFDSVICSVFFFDQIEESVQPPAAKLGPQAVYAKVNAVCQAPPQLTNVNPAFIRFTSGTTGDAKGVVLSHESVYERIHAANQVLKIGGNDRILWLLSMDYHFTVSIVAYLTFGAGIILPKNSFGVTLLNAATLHNATIIYGSPTHYSLMVQDDTRAVLPPALRFVLVTTAALSTQIADAFYYRFGRVLNETYGIIELGLPAINISNLREKQGSVGQAVPAYELRIECQPGEEQGEIAFRSRGMLDAYYTPWKERDSILQENGGWFKTGDLGKLDQDGFLYIVGRTKEMISVGGMKFFPSEVEAVLESHPAIRSACVFGVMEGQWGESPVADLVLEGVSAAPDEDTLRSYCKLHLASHKIPRSFQWVERLSYTASGKKIRNPEKNVLAKRA